MRDQRRCTWCGIREPTRGHACDPATLAAYRVVMAVRPAPAPAPGWAPRHPGRGGNDGSVARSIVLTPLGWARVSPAVRQRLGV
jgi:hypothetical protein